MTLNLAKLLSTIITISCVPFIYAQGTGLNFDERAYRSIPEEEKPMGFGENLPKSASLRKYAPFVANQGQYGTCVGWSSTYYAATIEYARLTNLSDQKLISSQAFDPYFTYLKITKESDYFSCSEGTLISSAANYLMKSGVKRFNYNTLDCGEKIDPTNKPDNVPFKITDFRRLIDPMLPREENIATVKQALSDGHPIVIGMALPKSFYTIDSTGLFKPEPTDKNFVNDYGGHAMAVIGFDDDRMGGTFEIINSWGDQWGDKGFVYVKYGDFVDFTRMGIRFEAEATTIKDEVGCVMGNCENGYGRLVYPDGSIYEGNFLNKERAGFGMFIWKEDLASFGGEWETSKRHGKGAFVDEKGNKQTGYWKNDQFVQGEIVINTINRTELAGDIAKNITFLSPKEMGALLQQKSIVDTLSAKLPQGCIYGNCQDGIGVLLGQNYIYFGGFQSGLRHGYGEMRWIGESWGNAYVGNSESNTRTGIGAYFWPNGNKYYGEWQNGSRNGLGTFFNANGDIQAGKFENNNFVSEGMGFGAAEVGVPLSEPKVERIVIKDKSSAIQQNVPSGKTKKKKGKA
jgi:hypothetical protein